MGGIRGYRGWCGVGRIPSWKLGARVGNSELETRVLLSWKLSWFELETSGHELETRWPDMETEGLGFRF